MNPILYAIPVFLLLIAIEALVARARGQGGLRLNDAIGSLSLGTLSQVEGVFGKLLLLGVYVWTFEHLRWFELSGDAWWVWAAGLVLYDFLYYWYHRFGHEVAVFWAAHVVHHQSEEYNLTTALRQTSSGFLLGWLLFLPMAVLGFPPKVFVVVALLDLLYQFWIHTEQVGKLGAFDRWFASPSNHRVHHAVNARYLDKNYGGVLMLWDRWFGTFVEEDAAEPPVYGTRVPLRSWNPLWANLDTYCALAADSWHAQRWSDKLRVWIKPPGWRPADVAMRFPKPAFDLSQRRKFDPPVTTAASIYCGLQYLSLIVVLANFLLIADVIGWGRALTYAGWIALSLYSLGRALEGRSQAAMIEALRLSLGFVSLLLGFPVLTAGVAGLAMGWLAISAFFAVWVLRPRAELTTA